jgi:zinc transport system substrate-binding protein
MSPSRFARTAAGLTLSIGCTCGSALGAAELDVVVSIKPVHSLVAGVMDGTGEPTLLVKGTGSEHSYSLRPSEARALEQAEVVFWVGETMETFLIKPLGALTGDAKVVELWKAPGLTLLATREGGMWQAHAHGHEDADADGGEHAAEHEGEHAKDHEGEGKHAAEHESEGEHAAEHESEGEHAAEHESEGEHAGEHQGAGGHAEADHAHGETDMHVWLDPGNAKMLTATIASVLSEADPENASIYQANAARLRQQLDELDGSLEDKLATIADRPYVVFHDAYQYLEHRYGVKAVGAIAINPTLRPSAQRLHEIQERLEDLDAACVFAEPQFEPALVDTVIEGTNAKKGVLDPLGAALDAGPDQYFQLMNDLADSLVSCLGRAQSG